MVRVSKLKLRPSIREPYAESIPASGSTIRPLSARKFVAGLHAGSLGHVAHRSFHRGEGKTNHATGVGDVVCPGIVALYVIQKS